MNLYLTALIAYSILLMGLGLFISRRVKTSSDFLVAGRSFGVGMLFWNGRSYLGWLLTIAGIVLGVAVFVGIHTANQSVVYAFRQTVDHIAGSTQLQISAGETGFDETVLDRVQAVPEVRVAVPVIEAVVGTGVQGQGNLLILGVDMTSDTVGAPVQAVDDGIVLRVEQDEQAIGAMALVAEAQKAQMKNRQ